MNIQNPKERIALKRLFSIINGSTPKSDTPEYWDGEIPWITPIDLNNDDSKFIKSSNRSITDAGLNSCGTSITPAGTIVISCRAPIGSIGITLNETCTNQGCKSLVKKSGLISEKFFYYALLSSNKELNSLGKGTTFLELSTDALSNYKVPNYDFEYQALIASFLDRETAKIDELIQKQEGLIQLYGERINTLVLDGLKNPSAKYMRLMHASENVSRPVSQEEDASYRPLGLYNRGRGIFIKEERDTDDMGDSNFFWVKSGDLIFSGQFAWEGSVAMAQVEHEGCVVSHRYPVIKGKEGVALTEYLLALFQTSHGDFLLNENSRGAAGRNRPLNISLLLKEKIPIIDMESQLKIKILIDAKEQFLKKSAQEIALLKEHRASLISAAVTGKIDVRELV